MDFKQQIFSVIGELTGQHNVLTINGSFVEFVGDLETGLFLSQLVYWTDKGAREDGFFYKTDEDWHKEIMLSKYSVRKSRKKLEEMGLLETSVRKANGNPTVHYKLDRDRFVEMFISFLRNQKNESSNTEKRKFENEISLTEITTEITTNKNIQYAEFVKMKESEYQKLVAKHGLETTNQMIKVLDNYKGSSGKKYNSDYRAILNWVEDKVLNQQGVDKVGQGYRNSRKSYPEQYDGLSI